MKRRILALCVASILCLSSSMTAFAATASSNTSDHSTVTEEEKEPEAAQPKTVENANPGQEVAPETVSIAAVSSTGAVVKVSYSAVIKESQKAFTQAAATKDAATLVQTVKNLATMPVSKTFENVLSAVATTRGSDMVVNNAGTVKTAAKAVDPFGNTIASAGVIKHVVSGQLILLMAVDEDGTVEYVEGVVDPVTGAVLGAFKGTPVVITVLVIA